MDLVKSLSIKLNTASTSPLGNLSGGLSTVHLVSRANPCCGPYDHGPNCGNTNGMPPRMAFLPSNTANLLQTTNKQKKERMSTTKKLQKCRRMK